MIDQARMARLLRDQGNLLTRRQALDLGHTAGTIRSELRSGGWRCAFAERQGVYLVDWGSAPMSYMQRVWAALLAVGGIVATSHSTAVWLCNQRAMPPHLVHLAVPNGRKVRPIKGVRIHTLPVVDATVLDPWRTPTRMRIEIAAVDAAHSCADAREALAIIYGCVQWGRASVAALERALLARKRHRHRAMLQAVLVDAADGAMSGLEREHLHCMRRHRLPAGKRQRMETGPNRGKRQLDVIHDEEVETPLVTELDGRLGHEEAQEAWRDMDRDNLDEELGRGHLRYGAAQVFGEGCRVAGQTRRALMRRGWSDVARRCGPRCVALEPGPG